MNLNALEHKLLDILRNDFQSFNQSKIWVSCSGGQDSVVLFECLLNLKAVLSFDLGLLHVHHGGNSKYRSNARDFVKKLAEKSKVSIEVYSADSGLKSEAEMREFRQTCYDSHIKKHTKDFIFLGHHKDDCIETILLRLIRGSGILGLTEVFSYRSDVLFHPFLEILKVEIEKYAAEKVVDYIKDPSNEDGTYLRNWIRNDWLNALESRRPGARKSLGRSLLNLSKELRFKTKPEDIISIDQVSGTIPMSEWLKSTESQKKSYIAFCLYKIKKKGYTEGQVSEVLKQLDQNKKNTTFSVGGMSWKKTQDLISFVLL